MGAPTPTEDLDPLGSLIRTTRKARGLSQDDLAGLLGIAQSEVSAIERGDRTRIDAGRVVALARALGLDPAAVLDAAAARPSSSAA